MTSRVIVRPGAERDATESYDYYESLAPGLGDRFLDELNRVLGHMVPLKVPGLFFRGALNSQVNN